MTDSTTILDPLLLLTDKVRLLTVEQIARLRFATTKTPRLMARQWITRQQANGLLSIHTMMVHPLLTITEPLLDYRGDCPDPDFAELAYRITRRWKERPVRTLIASATRLAKRRFGGCVGGRAIREREVTHDAHVAEVFLSIQARNPVAAESWTPEDALARNDEYYGNPIPDAVLAGVEPILIEFAGSYDRRKLERIHHAYRGNHYRLY